MTDRELLELATKAAGLEIIKHSQEARDNAGNGDVGLYVKGNDGKFITSTCWNPLTDDGHALRLAVRLRMTIKVASHKIEVFDEMGDCFESLSMAEDGDYLSITRFAIVRAAAEIGRSMP